MGIARKGANQPTFRGGALLPPPNVISDIWPSALWTGVAGSGWGPGLEPVKGGTQTISDPTSSFMGVNAAVGHFLDPPDHRAFVSDTKIHVIADAFMSDGSPGIDTVIFDCEGRTVSVNSETIDILSVNGIDEIVSSYAVNLNHLLCGINGTVRIYATIVPRNPALAARVIGPFVRRRKTTLWDRQIRIRPGAGADVPGVTYFGANAALNASLFCRNNAVTSVDTVIYSDGEAYIWNPSIASAFDIDTGGNILFEGRNGGTITLVNTLTDAFVNFNFRTNGLQLGRDFTIDIQRIGGLTKQAAYRQYSLLPGSQIKSISGMELPGSTGIYAGANAAKNLRITPPIGNNVFMSYGCTYRDMYYGPKNIARSVFDIITGIGEDIYAFPSGSSYFIYAPKVGQTVSELGRAPKTAFNLYYTGAGAATYSTSGTANGVRTLTLRVAGATVRSIVTSATTGTGIYTFADMVNDINTALGSSGWVAALVDDSFRAASIDGLTVANNIPVAVVGPGTPIVCWFDVHSDLGQQGNNGLYENFIVYGYRIKTTSTEPQVDFLSNAASGRARNGLYINCEISMCGTQNEATGTRSQFSGAFNHVVFKNVSRQNQDLLFRGLAIFDEFCGFFGVVYLGLATEAGTNVATMVTFKHNDFMLSNVLADNGTTRTNNTLGGVASGLYNGWDTGILVSKGGLLANPTPRFTNTYINGVVRPAVTFKGAANA